MHSRITQAPLQYKHDHHSRGCCARACHAELFEVRCLDRSRARRETAAPSSGVSILTREIGWVTRWRGQDHARRGHLERRTSETARRSRHRFVAPAALVTSLALVGASVPGRSLAADLDARSQELEDLESRAPAPWSAPSPTSDATEEAVTLDGEF